MPKRAFYNPTDKDGGSQKPLLKQKKKHKKKHYIFDNGQRMFDRQILMTSQRISTLFLPQIKEAHFRIQTNNGESCETSPGQILPSPLSLSLLRPLWEQGAAIEPQQSHPDASITVHYGGESFTRRAEEYLGQSPRGPGQYFTRTSAVAAGEQRGLVESRREALSARQATIAGRRPSPKQKQRTQRQETTKRAYTT